MMSLFVRETGNPQAPAIIFLHGLGLSSAMWQPQLELLSTYHCLAPDLPGHGQNADIAPCTLDYASQIVADLIRERVPSGRAHIVGLSLGGAVATRLLLKSPEVVDHLIVSGTSARLNAFLAALNRLNEPILRMLSPATLADLMLRQFNIPSQYHALLQEDLRVVKPDTLMQYTAELTRIVLPQQTSCPLLVVVGQKETLPARYYARKIRTTISGAQGATVPNVGHVWNMEQPALFSSLVHDWLTDAPLSKTLLPL